MNSVLLYKNGNNENIIISFVIPTYKRAKYLFDAIDSILTQPFDKGTNYEIVVINNAPESNMTDIIDRYKDCNISIYRNEINYGQVKNINQGVLLSKGKYVALLHDDDILLDNYYKTVKKLLFGNIEYQCLIPSYYEFDEKYTFGWKFKLVRTLFFFRYFYRKGLKRIRQNDDVYTLRDVFNAPTCGTIFLREELIGNGLFEDKYGAAWDIYNYRKLVQRMDIYLIHQYIGGKRLYTGMSNNEKVKTEFRDYLDCIKKECEEDEKLKRYADYLYVDRKTVRYYWTRIKGETYMYIHNLDGFRPIPYLEFRKIEKKYTI
jgi:glycosyltransferase involved in cell wall biosynthesis